MPLTNTGVLDPLTGQVQYTSNPLAGILFAKTAQKQAQPASASFSDAGVTFNQPNIQSPKMVQPSFMQVNNPTGGNLSNPALTKGGKLLSILLGSARGGLDAMASNAQTYAQTGRNAGFGGGVAAAEQMPWQRAMRPMQMQQMEAETQLAQAGLKPVQTPYGQMPAALATKAVLPWMIRGQAQTQSAQIGAQGRVKAAEIGKQGKLDAITLQTAILQHKSAKFLPDMDPQSGQPFYHMFNPFGEEIGRVDVNALASLMGKQSSTIDYKQLDDGSIVALPKTTVTTPIPMSGGIPGGGGRPHPQGGGITPTPVLDKQGNPVVGKGAITSTTRTMVETAPKVLDLVQRLRTQIQDLDKTGELGPGMSRWNEFWSGKIGADNPQFRAMRTNTALLSTLLMRMHVGARGGVEIMKHFDEIMDSGRQSPANMLANLDQIETYANEVKGAAPLPANYGKGNQQPTTVRMRAPNGQEQDVPANQVDHYKSKGAIIVQQGNARGGKAAKKGTSQVAK